MRLSSSRVTALTHRPQQDFLLWDKAGTRPSLDLQFADRRDLVDATTGSKLVDHTRASSGTYVGSDGLIKTATTNLLLRSEEFNATWTLSDIRAFGSGSVVDAAVAPDGQTTADLLTENNQNATHTTSQTVSITSGLTYTFSCFIKRAGGSRNAALILRTAAFGSAYGVNLDLSTGITSARGGATIFNSKSYGNGWWRVWITATATSTISSFVDIGLQDGAILSYQGDDASGIYVWGAQLEQSTTLGEYIPTTSAINSAPRFDHDPTTGESLGLLVEESRTNLALYSQDLTVTPTWTEAASSVALAPTVVDVFGGFTAAFKLTEDNANSAHNLGQGFTITGNTFYSVTAWFKSGSGNRDGRILLTNTAAWNGTIAPRARIEFSTGTAQNVFGFTTTDVIQYPNGWFKFVGTALSSSGGGTSAFRYLLSDAGAETYQGDGVSYIYIGPCQLEVGAFPTSYMKNVDAVLGAIRAADVATDTSTGADIRTLYAQFRSPASGTRPVASLDDNTANERIELFTSGTDPKLLVTDGGGSVADLDAGAITANVTAKLAGRFATDSYAAAVNGAVPQTHTSGTLPAVDRLRIGSNQAGDYFNGTIARLTGWNTPLPDETLQTITG